LDYSAFDDQILIALIAQKDPDALDELYQRYKRIVFSLAYNAVGNPATAEEITLDVFTRIWEHAKTYQTEQARVNTWLTRIARNRAIDVLRRQGSRGHQQTVRWAEAPDQLAAPQNSPEREVELSLQRTRIRRAIAQLPVEQQQALLLAYVKGFSHREIAEELEQPLGTVKTRIRQAMKKLRQLLVDERDR
jgi:RNA polymerase sigma-70 factor (ECF subfamily)